MQPAGPLSSKCISAAAIYSAIKSNARGQETYFFHFTASKQWYQGSHVALINASSYIVPDIPDSSARRRLTSPANLYRRSCRVPPKSPSHNVIAYASSASSIFVFSSSSATSLSASSSCANSALADASPFTPAFAIAGFLALSCVPLSPAGCASASKRSISAWAFAIFYWRMSDKILLVVV